jgi:hypothetical protein
MFGSSRAVLSMRESYREDLIDCYGIDEVASWDFEVWNEPTIDFWTGRPAHEMYFQLYDNIARSLKVVTRGFAWVVPRLRRQPGLTRSSPMQPRSIFHSTSFLPTPTATIRRRISSDILRT